MCILLSLVLFGTCRRGEKVGNKWNHKLSETILWAVTHHGLLVWLVVYSNNFCYFIMGYSTISAQCRLNLLVQIKALYTYTITIWVFTIPSSLVPNLFVGFYIPLIFRPFIMLVGFMVHVHSIKCPFRLVLGSPIPILASFGNPILWFIDSTES